MPYNGVSTSRYVHHPATTRHDCGRHLHSYPNYGHRRHGCRLCRRGRSLAFRLRRSDRPPRAAGGRNSRRTRGQAPQAIRTLAQAPARRTAADLRAARAPLPGKQHRSGQGAQTTHRPIRPVRGRVAEHAGPLPSQCRAGLRRRRGYPTQPALLCDGAAREHPASVRGDAVLDPGQATPGSGSGAGVAVPPPAGHRPSRHQARQHHLCPA